MSFSYIAVICTERNQQAFISFIDIVEERNYMKIIEYLIQKKWHIVSGFLFLAILAIIAGVFLHEVNSRFNNLEDQIDRISSGISSLEASTAAFKSSVDGMNQKSSADTSNQPAVIDLQSNIDDILERLSDLKKAIESLKAGNKAEMQPAKSPEKTITVPDTKVPEGSSTRNKTEKQPQSVNSVKTGQDFTITVMADEVSNLYGYQFNLNYDNKKANYKSKLNSSISGIGTIFKKDMTDHLLVGATMIGNTPGYSGKNVTVCTMVFTAIEDIDPSGITIDSVSTVDANQNYTENISGWSIDVKIN